jgi:hypothetical protein
MIAAAVLAAGPVLNLWDIPDKFDTIFPQLGLEEMDCMVE